MRGYCGQTNVKSESVIKRQKQLVCSVSRTDNTFKKNKHFSKHCRSMTKFLLASIIFFTSFVFGAGQVCEPCEENTRCEIAYTFQYTRSGLDQLIWIIDGKDAAVCHTRNGNTCELYPDFKGVVFSRIEKQSDLMTTNIQFTADRNNQLIPGKTWELVYSSIIVYTCDVHYYKKIDEAMCHHKISKKGLHIECTSANVYPKSCCNFSVKVNRASWDLHLSPEYNHTVVKADPVYFETVCALDIAPADLESGVWEVNVTMYPDIFNDDGKNCTPTNGGKTFLFNITIEHPVISLYNCPNAVDDGKEFVCICQRDDKSDVQTVVYWKKQGSTRKNNNISAVLTAIAKTEETGFTCIAENEFGWKTIFNYNIAIFKKIEQVKCHHQTSIKGLHIECTNANVYPKSCCDFSVKVNGASIDRQLSPAYNHTVVKMAPLHFDTVCALDIAQADLKPGLWEINVTMYPDIFNDGGRKCKPCKGGDTFRFNMTIEYPDAKLKNCPHVVYNGKEFVCICQREDKSDVKTVVYWEKMGSFGDKNNISAELRATANYEEAGFICIAKNEFGWKHSINYNIAIYNNPIDHGNDCHDDKPNNCFDKCYSDEEFCLDGKVYFCKDADRHKLHRLCQTKDSNEIQTNKCKGACQLAFNKHLVEEEKKEPGKSIDLVELLIILFIVITGLMCVVVKCYRSHKENNRQKDHLRKPLIAMTSSNIYIEQTIRDCFTCTEVL